MFPYEVALKVVASYFQNLLGLDDEKIPLLSSELISVFEVKSKWGELLVFCMKSCVCVRVADDDL